MILFNFIACNKYFFFKYNTTEKLEAGHEEPSPRGPRQRAPGPASVRGSRVAPEPLAGKKGSWGGWGARIGPCPRSPKLRKAGSASFCTKMVAATHAGPPARRLSSSAIQNYYD